MSNTFLISDLSKKLESGNVTIVYPFAYVEGEYKGAVDTELNQIFKKDPKQIKEHNAKNLSKTNIEKIQVPAFESKSYILLKPDTKLKILNKNDPNAVFENMHSLLSVTTGMTEADFLKNSKIWRIRITPLSSKSGGKAENILSGMKKEDIKPRIIINISIDAKDESVISFAKYFDKYSNEYRRKAYALDWIEKNEDTNPKKHKWSNFLYHNTEKNTFSITCDVDFSIYSEKMGNVAGRQKTIILCRDAKTKSIYPLMVTSDGNLTTLADYCEYVKAAKLKKDIGHKKIDEYVFTKNFDTFKILAFNLNNFKSSEYKNSTFNECKPNCSDLLVEIIDKKSSGNSMNSFVTEVDDKLMEVIKKIETETKLETTVEKNNVEEIHVPDFGAHDFDGDEFGN